MVCSQKGVPIVLHNSAKPKRGRSGEPGNGDALVDSGAHRSSWPAAEGKKPKDVRFQRE